jgi:hypothetical protein
VGVNSTLIEQVPPAARLAVQVFAVTEKSPVATTLVMLKDAVPEFVKVMACAALGVPFG